MGNRRAEIAMSDAEIRSFLEACRTVHVASINSDGSVHLVPMWFCADPTPGALAGAHSFWTYGQSQKIVNLRRDSRITCLVEAGDEYGELRGVQIVGRVTLSEDASEIAAYGRRMVKRYFGFTGTEAENAVEKMSTKRILVRVEPSKCTSWDHRLLP